MNHIKDHNNKIQVFYPYSYFEFNLLTEFVPQSLTWLHHLMLGNWSLDHLLAFHMTVGHVMLSHLPSCHQSLMSNDIHIPARFLKPDSSAPNGFFKSRLLEKPDMVTLQPHFGAQALESKSALLHKNAPTVA